MFRSLDRVPISSRAYTSKCLSPFRMFERKLKRVGNIWEHVRPSGLSTCGYKWDFIRQYLGISVQDFWTSKNEFSVSEEEG